MLLHTLFHLKLLYVGGGFSYGRDPGWKLPGYPLISPNSTNPGKMQTLIKNLDIPWKIVNNIFQIVNDNNYNFC